MRRAGLSTTKVTCWVSWLVWQLEGLAKVNCTLTSFRRWLKQSAKVPGRRPWLIGAAAAVIVGAGAYAVLQGSAASKASKLADEMEERSAELAPYATKIDNWNADTEVISEIGMEYAKAQESRQYWVGLLDELAEYFASDTVWVADFRPWSNYVPGDAGSGKSYVKSGFERLAFGESVVDLKSFDTRNYDGVKGVNAIRIDGFWRAGADGRNHRAVTEILERIKKGVADAEAAAEKKMEETGLEVEPDTHFILMKEDRDEREMVPLSDAEILVENNTTLGEDAYGAPFTIILPLREAKPMTELTKGKSIN